MNANDRWRDAKRSIASRASDPASPRRDIVRLREAR